MLICSFCDGMERDDLQYCKKCGHSLTRWHENYYSEKEKAELWIHFPLDEKEEQKCFFVECSGNLYRFWECIHNSYQNKELELTYTLTWEKLSLFGNSETPYSLREQFPSYIPATIEFFLPLRYEKYFPETGIRAWIMEMTSMGDIWIGEMSQPQRAKFLRWFLTTKPHASENGDLHFTL